MAFPSSDVSIPVGHEKKTSTTQRHPLGTRGVSQDGNRIFRYAEIGATAIGGGLLVQTAVEVGGSSNITGLNVVSASSGSNEIQVIPQHASSKNTYAEGYLISETSPNVALYQIRRAIGAADAHGDFTSGAAATIKLHPNDVLRDAFTSGTHTVGLSRNPYKGLIVAPATTPTGAIVGATPNDMAASVFGWVQTWGWAALHTDTAPVASQPLIYTGSSAGKAILATSALNDIDAPVVAWSITAGAGADAYNRVFLRISA